MVYKLAPLPTHVRAIIVALIHERLEVKSFEAAVNDVFDIIVDAPQSAPSQNYLQDLRSVLGEEEHDRLLKQQISSCYPKSLAQNAPSGDLVFAAGGLGWAAAIAEALGCLGAGFGGYFGGRKIGETIAEWWNEWNGELDQDFWEWLEELEGHVYYNSDGVGQCL